MAFRCHRWEGQSWFYPFNDAPPDHPEDGLLIPPRNHPGEVE